SYCLVFLDLSISTHFPYTTLFRSFSKINQKDFLPAFKTEIKNVKNKIEVIVNRTEAPTFENTVEALEFAGERLDRISNIFFNLKDRKSTRLNSSHVKTSYAVFCLK